MSGSTSKQTRRDIRRAFGSEAVATVAALDLRLRTAEAEIVALKLRAEKLARLLEDSHGLIAVEVNDRKDVAVRGVDYLVD